MANYRVVVACDKGTQQSERWTFTPTSDDIGTLDLAIKVYDSDYKEIANAKTKIVVIPADSGNGKPITWLMIGDSLTHASVYPEAVLNLASAPGNPSLTLLGTHHIDGKLPGNRHEGYGGWTWERFATFYSEINDRSDWGHMRSPFVFMENGEPKLDFGRYLKEECSDIRPDIITISLGGNDIFDADETNIEEHIDKAFKYADILLAEIRKNCPKSKIGLLMLIPPAATQDAFGANYGCRQTQWQLRRNQHNYIESMRAKFGNREAEGLYLIPTYVNIDTVYGFDSAEKPANSRSTQVKARQNNGMHPNDSGYNQMGDTVYNWMKYRISR
jgi:lysophospholipase L1-like esterase